MRDKLVEERLLLRVGAKAAVVPARARARMDVASFMLRVAAVLTKKNSIL